MNRWFKPVIAIFLLVYLIIQILSFRLHEKKDLSTVERTIVFMAVPVQGFFWNMTKGFSDVWQYYIALAGVSKQNEKLAKKIQEIESENIKMKELEAENKRLKDMLDIRYRENLKIVVADRIASGASPYERTIRVRKGTKDNIAVEMSVIHPDGVVGQISQASEYSSDILLITDLNSSVDALSQRSRARGIVRGAGVQELKFDFLAKNDDVQVGDEVVTTGLDGIYPKGIPIGVIIKLIKDTKGLFYEARIKPHVDFNRLEEVAIVESNLQKP